MQKILKYPKRAQTQQESGKISTPKDGYQTLEMNTLVVGTDDDEEASEKDKDDNPRANKIVVRKSKTSQSF